MRNLLILLTAAVGFFAGCKSAPHKTASQATLSVSTGGVSVDGKALPPNASVSVVSTSDTKEKKENTAVKVDAIDGKERAKGFVTGDAKDFLN